MIDQNQEIRSKRREVLKATGATGLGYIGMSAPAGALPIDEATRLGSTVFTQALVHYEVNNIEINSHIDQLAFFSIERDRNRLHIPVISSSDADIFANENGVIATPSPLPMSERYGVGKTTQTLTVEKTAYHKPQNTIQLANPIDVPTMEFNLNSGNTVSLEIDSGRTDVPTGSTAKVKAPSRQVEIADENRPANDEGPTRQASPIVTVENHGELDVYATEMRER